MARVRHVHGGSEKHTLIMRCDRKQKASGAYHEYGVFPIDDSDDSLVFVSITFQKGPVQEVGVNGCFDEDLLAIIADRLECLQNGKFPCLHNAEALAGVHAALLHLNERTRDRERRGVEERTKCLT